MVVPSGLGRLCPSKKRMPTRCDVGRRVTDGATVAGRPAHRIYGILPPAQKRYSAIRQLGFNRRFSKSTLRTWGAQARREGMPGKRVLASLILRVFDRPRVL